MPRFRLRFSTVLVLSLWFVASAAFAGVNFWSATGPFGSSVTGIAVDGRSPDYVYIGLEGLGVFRSTDGGFTWAPFNDGTIDLRVRDVILVDGPTPVLYVGTNGGGIYRTDAAANMLTTAAWEDVTNDLGNLFVLSLVFDPDFPDTIFAGTNGSGVFRSVNAAGPAGSVTWQPTSFGLGNRVVFDLELPAPISEIVINEVDAAEDQLLASISETMEFVEIHGPPNASLDGLLLTFIDGRFPGPGGLHPIYSAYDLDGLTLNRSGLLVIGDPGVPNVDVVPTDNYFPNAGNPGITILNRTGGVALYLEDLTGIILADPTSFTCLNALAPPMTACEFDSDCDVEDVDGNVIDEGLCSVPSVATSNDLIDALVYDVGGEDDDGLIGDLSVDRQVNENGQGALATHANARVPDGTIQLNLNNYTQQLPTPGLRNRPLRDLWAATDLKGVYTTRDYNAPNPVWVPINNELAFDIALELAVDPVDPDPFCTLSRFTVYAGTSGGGVFKSTDPCNLDLLDDWEPVNSGLEDLTIRSMEVAPEFPPDTEEVSSFLFAGTESGRVFRSSDEGNTWQEVSTGLGGLGVEALEVDPNIDPKVDFFRPSTVYAGTLDGGVFKTLDKGSNWFQTTNDLGQLIGIFVEALVIDPTDQSRAFAGTFGGGVFEGTITASPLDPDQREIAWNPVNTGLGSLFVRSLALDPNAPQVLYAGTEDAGLFKSTDGGLSWAASNTGLPDPSVFDIAFDPDDSNILFAATGGLFRSIDAGANWTRVDSTGANGFPVGAGIITVALADDPTNPSLVYAGTQNAGVFVSTNSGATWTEANSRLTESFIRALLVDPTQPEVIYAGTDGGGVFRTADGGADWTQRSEGLENLFVTSFAIDTLSDPLSPPVIYAGTDGGGVYVSFDSGLSWEPFNLGLTNFEIRDLALDPQDPKQGLAATSGGGVFEITQVDRFFVNRIGPLNSDNQLETNESGATSRFSVELASVPDSNVFVDLEISPDGLGEGTLSADTLVFTPGTALFPQTITVTGIPDGEVDDDVVYEISLTIRSTDLDFDGTQAEQVSVINRNIDSAVEPAVIVDLGGPGPLVVDENGAQATFDVFLSTAPLADVTVNISSSEPTEGAVTPTSLTFTAVEGANVRKTVTVTGVADGVVDGDASFTIVLDPAISGDLDYDNFDPDDVAVINQNVDSGAGSAVFFETAALGPTGQTTGTSAVNSNTFVAAKLTLTETFQVTSLGGHFLGDAGDPTIFAAVVPLNVGTDFPNDFALSDAVFSTTFPAPNPSALAELVTNFTLAPGRYAVVFGSGLFGATGSASLPGNDVDIPTPEYFVSNNAIPSWFDGLISDSRFFLSGQMQSPLDQIFADGFESGNASTWSLQVP